MAGNSPLKLDSQDVGRIVVIALGLALIATSFLTPWWTRGISIDDEAAEDGIPGVEGFYLQYGPFQTPGAAGITTDAGREAAVGVLGIAMVAATILISAHVLMRIGMRSGRIEENHDVPVRLAIGAFVFGLFAVIWGALFLPLAGQNPGMLWGDEYGEDNAEFFAGAAAETTRYANVGFYVGIVGLIGLPAFLWADAYKVREGTTWGTLDPAAEPA